MKIKIAVSYDNGAIGAHFGHAEAFAIYEYETDCLDMNEMLSTSTKTVVDASSLHGHEDMAKLMQDNGVRAVICGNMGTSAQMLLAQMNIVPVIGYEGDADTAADLLITGQLPTQEDNGGCGCGGGCGGCGGSCGDHEEGGCGGCCH